MGFTLPTEKKEEEKTLPSFSNKDIESWIQKEEHVNSSICALYVGHPKTGKTGSALDNRTPEEIAEGKTIWVVELNSDNGCKVNKKEHHNNDPTIIVLDPREITIDTETGDYNFDYKRTMAKIKSLFMYLKENKEKLKIKAIVFDGVDVFLSEVCEGQMRIDKHIDVAGGVNMAYWKARNDYFYKIMNMLFTIDVDIYLITHYKKDDDGKFIIAAQTNFPDKVHQIVEFRKDGNKFFAKLTADRRKITDDRLNKDVLIAEQTDKGMKWHGFKL